MYVNNTNSLFVFLLIMETWTIEIFNRTKKTLSINYIEQTPRENNGRSAS